MPTVIDKFVGELSGDYWFETWRFGQVKALRNSGIVWSTDGFTKQKLDLTTSEVLESYNTPHAGGENRYLTVNPVDGKAYEFVVHNSSPWQARVYQMSGGGFFTEPTTYFTYTEPQTSSDPIVFSNDGTLFTVSWSDGTVIKWTGIDWNAHTATATTLVAASSRQLWTLYDAGRIDGRLYCIRESAVNHILTGIVWIDTTTGAITTVIPGDDVSFWNDTDDWELHDANSVENPPHIGPDDNIYVTFPARTGADCTLKKYDQDGALLGSVTFAVPAFDGSEGILKLNLVDSNGIAWLSTLAYFDYSGIAGVTWYRVDTSTMTLVDSFTLPDTDARYAYLAGEYAAGRPIVGGLGATWDDGAWTAYGKYGVFEADLAGPEAECEPARISAMCCVVAPDETRDELYVVTERYINGGTKRYIEYMAKTWESTDEQEDAFYVDCGWTAVYDEPTTETTGLWFLEGETVGVYVDGMAHVDCVVTNGKITHQAGLIVTLGFFYDSDAQTMPLDGGSQDGSSQGKTKRIHRVGFWLLDTLGLKYGPDADNLTELLVREWGDPHNEAVPLFTGIVRERFEGDYDRVGQIYWRASGPFPANVLADMPQFQTNDDG